MNPKSAINTLAVFGPDALDNTLAAIVTIMDWLYANEWVLGVVGLIIFFHLLLKAGDRRMT